MTKVFVSGSMSISSLDDKVLERLKNIVDSRFNVIVGDAKGVDSSVQRFLNARGMDSVVVYCSGDKARNNIGGWVTKRVSVKGRPGTRGYFSAKDRVMADDCDYGLIVWDARSTGTLSNALELVRRRKAALVYINRVKQFMKVKDAGDIEVLLGFMSDSALKKADKKMGLLKELQSMKYAQHDLFAAGHRVTSDAPTPHG